MRVRVLFRFWCGFFIRCFNEYFYFGISFGGVVGGVGGGRILVCFGERGD